MFRFIPSQYTSTIALEVTGKITGEDAARLDEHVKNNFHSDEKFNLLAHYNDIEGTTVRGLIDGTKFDAKRWEQFDKFAVISEHDWMDTAAKAGDKLPGIQMRHFHKDEIDKAWSWLSE
ncbi:STAS/SEC14 domain-containing protein [Thalassobacillus pellis]|uniref:STAS/SEC14 domain-containing protein n=1 Tax=Thalassobacillus pellis TaxID=748008 RepID=UPI00195F9D37|nr:STAS/SEC14 domain-containing protein [Thalassobacillus pellis]MBM7553119.1 hypothetical protein [Thalassobacillus pellis]